MNSHFADKETEAQRDNLLKVMQLARTALGQCLWNIARQWNCSIICAVSYGRHQLQVAGEDVTWGSDN